MKKSILTLAILATMGVATAIAQPRAIGGQISYGLEASYEHSVGNNFVTVDLGLNDVFVRGIGISAMATYNWLNPFGADFPTVSQGDWNWYMGVGLAAGGNFKHYYNYKSGDTNVSVWHNYGYVGAAGRIGVEYNFWFPLQLSAEWRPVVGPRFGYNYYKGNTDPSFYEDGLWLGGIVIGFRYNF